MKNRQTMPVLLTQIISYQGWSSQICFSECYIHHYKYVEIYSTPGNKLTE